MIRHNERREAASLLDLTAIGASAACLAHCLILPLLFAALPAISAVLAIPESFHLVTFTFAVPASAAAMAAGYRRHGEAYPPTIAAAGLLLLSVSVLGGLRAALEIGLSIVGSLVLAAAHVSNWHLRRTAGLRAHPR